MWGVSSADTGGGNGSVWGVSSTDTGGGGGSVWRVSIADIGGGGDSVWGVSSADTRDEVGRTISSLYQSKIITVKDIIN